MRKNKNIFAIGQRKKIFRSKGFKQALSLIMVLFMCLVLLPIKATEASGKSSFNSNYIYLDTRSMSKNYDYSFNNYDSVRLYSANNGFRTKSGITEIDGVKYLYWESLNDDSSFFFTYGNTWNTIDNVDYTRTEVIGTSISQAKGNVFYWDSVSMVKIKASNKQIKEQYVLNKKEVYSQTLTNINSNYIYLDATDMIETANWASAGRNNVVLYVASENKDYTPTGIGKYNDRYYIYWNAQNYNLTNGIIFVYRGKYGDSNDLWTLKNNKQFCRTEYVNGNTEFINDNSGNSGIKGKIFYPIVNANGFDDNKTNELENTYSYKLGTRTEFDNKATISKGDDSQDIPTGTFTQNNSLYYVNSTIYDYYSDYELMAGKDRSTIRRGENNVSYTNDQKQICYRNDVRYNNNLYMPERIFDMALSDYYKSNSVEKPIYFGHFQSKHSEEGTLYHNIATELNLYGYSENNEAYQGDYDTKRNVNNFYNNNNSEWRLNCANCAVDKNHVADDYKDPNKHETSVAVQGLVNTELTNNNLTVGSKKVEAPYFSESFLRGNNTSGVNLGNVYKNVAFPFVMNSEGYWEFNSADSSQTLRLKKDSSNSQYYMDRVGADNQVEGFTDDAPTTVSNYFPFNDKEDSGNVYKLNYGFGTRFDIKFTLTEDGTIIQNGSKKNIEFNFSGDDDVWVFIDGKLALDIGGGHGAVTGKIDFGGESVTKTATVGGESVTKTATVSGVKTSDGTEFNKKNKFDIVGSNTKEHTLTMFYMERGIWESNMKITFNFPKHNNFEVEKTVEIPEVNEIFTNAIKNLKTKSFDFSIKNLVTDGHEYSGSSESIERSKAFNSYTAADKDNTISKVYDVKSQLTVKYSKTVQSWFAPSEKKGNEGQNITDKRIVKIYSDSSKNPLNVSNVSDYLTFEVFNESGNGDTGTSPFIALVDNDGTRIGAWLGDGDYAYDNSDPNIGRNIWKTIKVDLQKLKNKVIDSGSVAGFDFSSIKEIQFAYWNDVTIYTTPFIFNKSVEIADTDVDAFTTDQKSIKDYGSNSSKQLEPANGAIYSVSGQDGYKEVSSGSFAIKDGETATFRDQFRKGSYISVSENGVDPNIFETTWTIYDSGKEVSKGDLQKETTNVKQTENKESVTGVQGFNSGDGREVKGAVSGITQPSDAIAFYRYDSPDNENLNVNLKVSYNNKLKTGSLKIKKTIAEGEVVDKNYKFIIVFDNVAGMGLEDDNTIEGNQVIQKEVYLNPSHTAADKVPNEITISGIPAGTFYSIKEIKENGDEFTLKEVTQNPESQDTVIDLPNYTVTGTIVADQDKKLNFGNVEFPTVEVKGEKNWEGNEEEINKPTQITIKLERKVEGADSSTYERAKDKDGNEIPDKIVKIGDNWEYGYSGLPKYVDPNANPKVKYEYRVVEVKVGDQDVANSGYKPEYSTDADGNLNITNKRVGSITINKVDEDDNPLNGAIFKLEKRAGLDTSTGEYVWDTIKENVEASGGDSSSGTPAKCVFDNLEPGCYRITETKAPSGYNKLKEPIEVELPYTYETGTVVNGATVTAAGNTMDITFKIGNQKGSILPTMGGQGILKLLCMGFVLITIAGAIFACQKRQKKA